MIARSNGDQRGDEGRWGSMESTSDHSGLVGWNGEVPQHGDQLGVVVDGVDLSSDRIVVEVQGLHLRDSQDV